MLDQHAVTPAQNFLTGWASVTPQAGPTIKIYTCHHRAGPILENDVFVPIQVGRSLAPPIPGTIGDNTGKNISHKNRQWCELTALYWVRHNVQADYYGLNHYRRFLSFRPSDDPHDHEFSGFDSRSIDRFGWEYPHVAAACRAFEIITAVPESFAPAYSDKAITALEHYSFCHHRMDLESAVAVIKADHPGVYPFALDMLRSTAASTGNLIIMRRDYFVDYVDWLFDVLTKTEQKIDTHNYGEYQTRVFGFLAERLQNAYIAYAVTTQSARHGHLRVVRGEFAQPGTAPKRPHPLLEKAIIAAKRRVIRHPMLHGLVQRMRRRS